MIMDPAFQSQLKLYSAPKYISICVLFNYTSVEIQFNHNKSKPTSLSIIIKFKGPEKIVFGSCDLNINGN